MKHKIILFLMLVSLIFISCDSDYSGEVSDSFDMYYAVEDPDSSSYSLEFYVNSTGGIISLDNLSGNYISDSLVMSVTESDSFYMKLTKMFSTIHEDTLIMKVYKGRSVFAKDTLFGTGVKELKGKFNQ